MTRLVFPFSIRSNALRCNYLSVRAKDILIEERLAGYCSVALHRSITIAQLATDLSVLFAGYKTLGVSLLPQRLRLIGVISSNVRSPTSTKNLGPVAGVFVRVCPTRLGPPLSH